MAYKPTTGRNYWMINSRFEIRETTHTGSNKSKQRIKAGNCFRTEKDARRFRKAVIDGSVLEVEKAEFDKRIAFVYGLVTGAFIVGMLWINLQ